MANGENGKHEMKLKRPDFSGWEKRDRAMRSQEAEEDEEDEEERRKKRRRKKALELSEETGGLSEGSVGASGVTEFTRIKAGAGAIGAGLASVFAKELEDSGQSRKDEPKDEKPGAGRPRKTKMQLKASVPRRTRGMY